MSLAFAILFYIAIVTLIVGIIHRSIIYIKSPVPLKIPTTPAPITKTGVIMRIFREVVFFESLFKSTKWTWIFSWLFHVGFFAILIRHGRYFHDLVPIVIVSPLKYMAFTMIIGLVGLLIRRITVNRVRYISSPSDYFMLILLILIGITGSIMTFSLHTDIVMVKGFFQSLIWPLSGIKNLPKDLFLLIHLFLVAILMLIFPISKLLHMPGIFFSPSRNQVDNPREKYHIADWAKKLEQN